jgi:xylose isomerase
MDALRAANDRINSLDHESLVWASEHPDKARGWIEAYMVRARAMDAERLPPMWKVK